MATKKAAARKPAAKKAMKKAATKKARPAKKAKKVAPVPKGYRTVTPYLTIRGAADALAFYAQAFGAKEKVRMSMPDGSIMHAEIQIGDSMVMIAEENPGWGTTSPQTLGGNATSVMLYVKDCDAFVARAVGAGAKVTRPLENQFWGDRYGQVQDPYGHKWSVATHVEDVSPKQMKLRVEAAIRQMGPPAQE